MLLGDYFGFDYRLVNPQAEMFHQIANFAFFDRNFSDFGLHYFNMQVDFYFQLLRRFYPAVLSERLRAAVKNFIKETNLDTYAHLSAIYDFVAGAAPGDRVAVEAFAREIRASVDSASAHLQDRGQLIIDRLEEAYDRRADAMPSRSPPPPMGELLRFRLRRYSGSDDLRSLDVLPMEEARSGMDFFGVAPAPVPYAAYKARIAQLATEAER